MAKRTPLHFNGNQLCSIAVSSIEDNLTHLAIIPLDSNFQAYEAIPLLDLVVVPSNLKEQITGKQALNILQSGVDEEVAFDCFVRWFENLPMKENKKIVPLCFNWNRVSRILGKFTGDLHLQHMVSEQVRDLYSAGNFVNDYADTRAAKIPFPLLDKLSVLAVRLNMTFDSTAKEDALYVANEQAKIYHALLRFTWGISM